MLRTQQGVEQWEDKMPYTIANNTDTPITLTLSNECTGTEKKVVHPGWSGKFIVNNSSKIVFDKVELDPYGEGYSQTFERFISHSIEELLNKGLTITGQVSEWEKEQIENEKKRREEELIKLTLRHEGKEKREKKIKERYEHYKNQGVIITPQQAEELLRGSTYLQIEHFGGDEYATFKENISIYFAHIATGKLEPITEKNVYRDRELSIHISFAAELRQIVDWVKDTDKWHEFLKDNNIIVKS